MKTTLSNLSITHTPSPSSPFPFIHIQSSTKFPFCASPFMYPSSRLHPSLSPALNGPPSPPEASHVSPLRASAVYVMESSFLPFPSAPLYCGRTASILLPGRAFISMARLNTSRAKTPFLPY